MLLLFIEFKVAIIKLESKNWEKNIENLVLKGNVVIMNLKKIHGDLFGTLLKTKFLMP